MARWNFHQRIAVFYIYLIAFVLAEPVIQSPIVRRGIFGDLQPVKYDQNGDPIIQDIVKRTEPLLEVSNHIQVNKSIHFLPSFSISLGRNLLCAAAVAVVPSSTSIMTSITEPSG